MSRSCFFLLVICWSSGFFRTIISSWFIIVVVTLNVGADAIFAVIIMSIVVRRIWDDSHSLDARDLSELRG